MKKHWPCLFFALHLGLWAPRATATEKTTEKLKVITSFSILRNLVEEVGGDTVEVQSLIASGVDPHGFHPRPSDVMQLKSAHLFLSSGLGLDPWARSLWTSAQSQAAFVDVSQGIKALPLDSTPDGERHEHHHHGALDPHYWHDPARVRVVIDQIARKLTELRPSHSPEFEARAQSLAQKIKWIEEKTQKDLQSLNLKNPTALTPHDGFRYLGQAFGIRFVSVQGVSTAQDLSAARLAKLQKMLERNEVQVAFFEMGAAANSPAGTALKPLLQKNQIPTESLYSDSLTNKEGGAESYIQLLEQNTRRLVKAFQQAGLQTRSLQK